MKIPDHIEINKIAVEFLRLRKLANNNPKDKNAVREFKKYQNYCMQKLEPLIDFKTRKYKRFSNYNDLRQDGFEALIMALETYKPKKGDFSWWANKYISTRISRTANAHSTIKFPLSKAKKTMPYKVSRLPLMISYESPLQHVEHTNDFELIMQAINTLPELQKQIILMHHEFDGGRNSSISKMSKFLNISRNTCVQVLSEAEDSIRSKLELFYK